MTTNMKNAQELIFGAGSLGASNFKMFPGSSREATAESIAANVSAALAEIEAGNAEEIVIDC